MRSQPHFVFWFFDQKAKKRVGKLTAHGFTPPARDLVAAGFQFVRYDPQDAIPQEPQSESEINYLADEAAYQRVENAVSFSFPLTRRYLDASQS